jgi:hypothetical protein
VSRSSRCGKVSRADRAVKHSALERRRMSV